MSKAARARGPQPRYPVRPGVVVPDWTVVTSPAAREALLAILDAFSAERAWRDYSQTEDRVRTTLLRLYDEEGRAPAIDVLARRVGLSEIALRPILTDLKARDLVVLDADDARITGVYPLTDRDTEHRVRTGDREINAMCAIDALGVGDMYKRDVEINSRCRACGAAIAIATSDRGHVISSIQPASSVVWSGIRQSEGNAAGTLCRVIAFFCGDAHLEAWRAEHHPRSPGLRLSIEEALEVGRALFAPSLAFADMGA